MRTLGLVAFWAKTSCVNWPEIYVRHVTCYSRPPTCCYCYWSASIHQCSSYGFDWTNCFTPNQPSDWQVSWWLTHFGRQGWSEEWVLACCPRCCSLRNSDAHSWCCLSLAWTGFCCFSWPAQNLNQVLQMEVGRYRLYPTTGRSLEGPNF